MTPDDRLEAIHSALVGTLDKPGLLDEVRDLRKCQTHESEQTAMFRQELTSKIDIIEVRVNDNSKNIVELQGFKNKLLALTAGAGLSAGGMGALLQRLFGGGNSN